MLTEPVGQAVEVSLRYIEGVTMSVYAGNGERDMMEERLENCSFLCKRQSCRRLASNWPI